MLKPTIHGCNFPYRGPKSRQDISGVLTSGRYDICRCIDETRRLETRRKVVLGFFLTGQGQDLSIEYRQSAVGHDLIGAVSRCEDIRMRGTRILFGG